RSRSSTFQILTAPSDPPVASQSIPPHASQILLGRKASASTVPPSDASGIMSVGSPPPGFHNHAVPSVRQHDASDLESGENVRNVIGARGPSAGGCICCD